METDAGSLASPVSSRDAGEIPNSGWLEIGSDGDPWEGPTCCQANKVTR